MHNICLPTYDKSIKMVNDVHPPTAKFTLSLFNKTNLIYEGV